MNSTATFVIEGRSWSVSEMRPGVYRPPVNEERECTEAIVRALQNARVISVNGERVLVAHIEVHQDPITSDVEFTLRTVSRSAPPAPYTLDRVTVGGKAWPPKTDDVKVYLASKEKRTTLAPMR